MPSRSLSIPVYPALLLKKAYQKQAAKSMICKKKRPILRAFLFVFQ